MKKILQILVVMWISTIAYAQPDPRIQAQLDSLALIQPGLNEQVQVSVSGVTLSDFISAISLEHNLNVSVDDNLNKVVVNNFYDALVKDVFTFLATKHDLDLEITGTIIAFKKKEAYVAPPEVVKPKEIVVEYNDENEFLTLDLKRDSLERVAEEITRKSGKNVVLSPEIKGKIVSVYIENRPFAQTLEMMGKSNGLTISEDENGFFFVEQAIKETKPNNNNGKPFNGNQGGSNQGFAVALNEGNVDLIDVVAKDAPIQSIIEEASKTLGQKYFMYDIPTGNATLDVEGLTFAQLLSHLLNGSTFTHLEDDRLFLIGSRNGEGLRGSELIQLQNRTIETVLEFIPADLTQDLVVNKFVELNGLIVTGSAYDIRELKEFIHSIDVVVPMVQIDVIIVQTRKSSGINTGIKAGVGDAPVATNGDVFPGLDVTMGAETINGLLNALSGFGLINLGAVTPNFYLSLQALESNSNIEIESTPKIATLNGHEASFTVGETDYYQEERVAINPSISGGNVTQNRVWKSTDANLSIVVTPFVSSDEYVTLDIKVDQQDFGGRVDPTAPPNKTTQTFSSLIRVKNGEMILMGGLEKESKEDSGSGTPVLSRIPIIKWFFSSRKKEKEKVKLHVFIKTTVTY
ncbi:MAG: type II and III secretion system protein [Crocinitomicaceae bacterium]